jgi:hypothetical protein
VNRETIGAFARCLQGECKFEVACCEPSTAIAFVSAAFARHQLEVHGVKVARP